MPRGSRRLLVTGGAGFIGSQFVAHWLACYPGSRLVVLDALTYAGNPANLDGVRGRPEFLFVHGDIRDGALVAALLRDERLDTVVHLAAESNVDRSIAWPDAFVATNVVGTLSLLEAARRVWLGDRTVAMHRFHQVSTDEVYGPAEPGAVPCTESSRYAPSSPYAASKAAADHLVRAYARTYGLNVSISTSSNNYGPRQFPEKLIPRVVVNVLLGLAVPVYGDGTQRRNWLHVEDHCRGLADAIERGAQGETYHFGADGGIDNLTLVRRLCSLVDAAFVDNPRLAACYPRSPMAKGLRSDTLISSVADRPGHDRFYSVDGAKTRRELGYETRIAFERGLADVVTWYVSNADWWEPTLPDNLRRVLARR
jgi:dTDP-glucose 4,6-dehydratase